MRSALPEGDGDGAGDRRSADGEDFRDGIAPDVYRQRWRTLGVLNLALVIIVIANSSLTIALPTLVRALGATAVDLQWIVDAYAIVFGGLLLTMGALGDRYGRKGAFQMGLVIFGAASAAAIWATSAAHLVAAQAVMGLGAALIMPATLSILTTTFPRREVGKAMGIWVAFVGVGGTLGPLLGGVLLEAFAWQAIYAINLPVVALTLAGAVAWVPGSRESKRPRLDPLGTFLSVVALAALLFGIIEAPVRGWSDELVAGSLIVGVVALVSFLYWENATAEPLLPLEFFREPGFTIGTTVIAMTFFSLFAIFFIMTQYLQFVASYSPLQTGLMMLPYSAGMLLGAPNSDRMARRLGTARTVAGGLLLLVISLASYGSFDATTPFWAIAFMFFVGGLGMGFAMAPTTHSIMDAVPASKAGVGSAMNDTSREVGGAIGIAVLGNILNLAYRSKLSDHLQRQGFDGASMESALQSLGAALELAGATPGAAGTQLEGAALDAFLAGMAWAFGCAAVLASVAAVLALTRLPELHDAGLVEAPA